MVDRLAKDNSSAIAIAWCLAWGEKREPQVELQVLERFRMDLCKGKDKTVIPELQVYLKQAKRLQELSSQKASSFPKTLRELQEKHPELWAETTPIGLVYGGATKIKQYVFEGNNLQDIRGASALLDRINLVDLPGFFKGDTVEQFPECQKAQAVCQKARSWLQEKFPGLESVLIPELIIYSTGGNILAFCPSAYINDLANAIERRYTEETLCANSCAVGAQFRLLELHYGLLPQPKQKEFWLNNYIDQVDDQILQAYFTQPNDSGQSDQSIVDEQQQRIQEFIDRKTFSELVTKLASQFNQRRGGMDWNNRPSRRFPPMFETHPYLQRDDSGRRAAISRITDLPSKPKVSLPSARKRVAGQFSKRDDVSADWFTPVDLDWQIEQTEFQSWVSRFEAFLNRSENQELKKKYYQDQSFQKVSEARNLPEIGITNTPKGFIAHIYADGNNIGGYIQKCIKSPESYKDFSHEIFDATQQAVYKAIAQHLQVRKTERVIPRKVTSAQGVESLSEERIKSWIHPFEILTIGGDDVSLVVPADSALAIARTIGEEFENILRKKSKYQTTQAYSFKDIHRYHLSSPSEFLDQKQSVLSMSMGVLLCADNTPFYYAQVLVEQLLKSAKKRAKDLKSKGYLGGTIDFLVMKSVDMISSNIKEFRAQALTKASLKLKLYAAPYTLHEIGGLLTTVKVLKDSGFPRSQLYQVRSFLEQGKRTAILNYRYFRTRLDDKGEALGMEFEEAWCSAKTNGGNVAPWISILGVSGDQENDDTTYETIWRDLIDLFPFTRVEQMTTEKIQLSIRHNPLSSSEKRSRRH